MSEIDIEACYAWLKENVTDKGLIAANPMTGHALARAKSIPSFYATQIVDNYNEGLRK